MVHNKSTEFIIELASCKDSSSVNVIEGEQIKTWLKTEEASRKDISEVASILHTNLQYGLSAKEVEQRQQRDGYNEFQLTKHRPIVLKYIKQFKDPLILLLLVGAAISMGLGNLEDAVGITVAVIIVVTLAFFQEYRSEKALDALTQMVPLSCNCVRKGNLEKVEARDLVTGDVVSLSLGDRVPADIRLFHLVDLEIDESSFTGEMEPVTKSTEVTVKDTERPNGYTAMTNMAFMGTLVRRGSGKGVVVNTAERSEFGEVFKMMLTEKAPLSPLQRSMRMLGTQLTVVSLVIIACISLLDWYRGKSILTIFSIGISLAVAAIPEGLPIVVAVTLALGVIRMEKRKVIVKKLHTVEALGCVNVICCDKTGTITKNEMTVTDIMTSDGYSAEVTGTGYGAEGEIQISKYHNAISASEAVYKLLEVGCVCNNAVISNNRLLGQPTEGALVAAANKNGMLNVRDSYVRLQEHAFSSEEKIMTVQCMLKGGDDKTVYFMKGAIHMLLPKCTTYSLNGILHPMTEKEKLEYLSQASNFGQKGLRVLGLAKGSSLDDMVYLGLVGICDPPQPFVRRSVQTLLELGVMVKMVTGDSKETAIAIANMISLETSSEQVMSGEQIEGMTAEQLQKVVISINIFYRVSPRHKLSIVQALQKKKLIVGMTGDGVNDAVAIKKADIGIAMGHNGTDVCKEAADMVLVDNDFSAILSAIGEGKGIFQNIRNFVQFQLTTSLSALSIIVTTAFMQIPCPLNAIQILWINVIMDGPPAQSLGVEPVGEDITSQGPRNVKEPMLNNPVWFSILCSACIMVCGTVWIFNREVQDHENFKRASTMAFTCFVFFNMFNAIGCRSQTKSVFRIGLFSNTMFLLAIGFSFFFQFLIIYIKPFQIIFKTEELQWQDILLVFAVASSVFIFSEIRKLVEWIIRLYAKHSSSSRHELTTIDTRQVS